MKKIISIILCMFMISMLVPSYAHSLATSSVDENPKLSLEINDETKPIQISEKNIDNMPKQIQNYLKSNKDHQLIDCKIFHYELKDNNGKIEKELIKTFTIKDDITLNEYVLYKENYKLEEKATYDTSPMAFKPRENQDVFLGISAYSFNHPSRPTAYQVQGWWKWDTAGLGIFSSRWDIIGLNFQGETLGYDYVAYANNVHTGAALSLNIQGADDNGVAFQHSQQPLSEGAILGKVISSNGNTSQNFRVDMIYEYMDSAPNPTYKSRLINYLIGLVTNLPPLPSTNERFDNNYLRLYYGR